MGEKHTMWVGARNAAVVRALNSHQRQELRPAIAPLATEYSCPTEPRMCVHRFLWCMYVATYGKDIVAFSRVRS